MSQFPGNASGAISFTYLAEIAVGATSRVDLCRASDGRLLAVKRLHPHVAEDPGFATQFLDEVWMTASLKHPNVVEVAGWGADDEGSYLAVELVQGVSLSRLMKTVFDTGEQFTERMVVYMCSKLCSGLAAAHALRSQDGELLSLVHRDLTPGNVLVGFDGALKIADFGLAKAKLRLTKTLTGLAKGQPTYMAPEQAKALDIDKRADLFSLGIVMFELFAGRRPWLGTSDYEMMQRTANEPPADLRESRPKIDKELVAIVNKCLEKSPDARFQSAEEIQARLDEWLHVHGYMEGSQEALARFVRRNAMRQMRWFERAISGEISPTSRPRIGRQLAPRTPSYQMPSSVAPRLARPERPRVVDENTDVSDAAQQIAQRHAQSVQNPVIREAPSDPDTGEWSEEVPTLVQREGQPALGRAPQRVDLARRPSGIAPLRNNARGIPIIVDEESDQRTTAVKQRARVNEAQTRGAVARPLSTSAPSIMDMDSEELPTMPVAAQPGAAQTSAKLSSARPMRSDARSQQQAPPRVQRPPGRPPSTAPPPPATARAGSTAPPPRSAAPGRAVSRASAVPPPPPMPRGLQAPDTTIPTSRAAASAAQAANAANGGGALAMNAVEAVRAAVFAATAEHARISAYPGAGEEMSPAPMGLRNPPTYGQDADADDTNKRPLTQDRLMAEADRLAIEAVRRSEEARTAASRAERKSFQAKLAGEAAFIAAEAVRLAQASGLGAAQVRLDQAHEIERRMLSSPTEGPASVNTPQQHPSSYGAPLSVPPPSGPMSSPLGVPPSALGFSSPRFGEPPPSIGEPARSSFEPMALQFREKPVIFGLSAKKLAAITVGAVAVVLLLVWLVFG